MSEVCLAERRKRQKWSSDPRGCTWSKDKDKFGYRMLEKMGWSDGAGLGASQDGRTSHVKINYKNNTLGLGTTQQHADDWIGHQSDFDGLLASLQQSQGPSPGTSEPASAGASGRSSPSAGLQAKAHQSKARINYSKFLRGKDISGYSSVDMSCILGQRGATSSSAATTSADCSALRTVRSNAGSNEESSGSDASSGSSSEESNPVAAADDEETNLTVSGQSVQDYFAAKMAKLKRSGPAASYLNASSQADAAPSSGKTSDDQKCKSSCDEDAEQTVSRTQKKKNKSKKKRKSQPTNDDDESADEHQPAESVDRSSSKKSKKRKKHSQASREASGGDDSDAEPVPEPAKKRKKAKKSAIVAVELATESPSEDSEDQVKSQKKKKKKNKKKKSKHE